MSSEVGHKKSQYKKVLKRTKLTDSEGWSGWRMWSQSTPEQDRTGTSSLTRELWIVYGRREVGPYTTFIPLRQWCISPCIRFPPTSKKVSDSVENFKIFPILPFPYKFFQFHLPKFLMTFFSHWMKILNFPPIFAISEHPPLFRDNYYFPSYFCKFPLIS